MTLRCGIVGLPNVGKSTIFNAITAAGAQAANFPFCTIDPNIGVVPVPDPRLERIHAFVETERVVPAELEVVDIAGLVRGASKGEGLGNRFLGHIKEVEAVLHVVRCFEDDEVIHVDGRLDAVADVEIVETELALADLDTLERALDRTARKARAGDKTAGAETEVFEKVRAHLEAGGQARSLDLSAREAAFLRPLFLLTAKPVLYVANVGENEAARPEENPEFRRLAAHAEATSAGIVTLSGKIEGEFAELDPEEREAFLAEAGLEEAGLDRLVREAYHLLGLRTFFTAGPKEIHAWTFREGARAPQAAGVIHSDFEKKFIRAEIHSIEDLETHGGEAAIRAAGKLRVEGKDYLMRDGDVAHFLIGS